MEQDMSCGMCVGGVMRNQVNLATTAKALCHNWTTPSSGWLSWCAHLAARTSGAQQVGHPLWVAIAIDGTDFVVEAAALHVQVVLVHCDDVVESIL